MQRRLRTTTTTLQYTEDVSLAITDVSARDLCQQVHECWKHVAEALCASQMPRKQREAFLQDATDCPYLPTLRQVCGHLSTMRRRAREVEGFRSLVQGAGGSLLGPGLAAHPPSSEASKEAEEEEEPQADPSLFMALPLGW